MRVTLVVYPYEHILKSPEQMLDIIAIALNMSTDCYRMRSRERNIVELRFIGAMLLRMNYPTITLHQIAALFGGQDHTSIISGLARAQNLIYTGDTRFLNKYNIALKSVNLWLKREA